MYILLEGFGRTARTHLLKLINTQNGKLLLRLKRKSAKIPVWEKNAKLLQLLLVQLRVSLLNLNVSYIENKTLANPPSSQSPIPPSRLLVSLIISA
jgi:hypothetical protein